MKNTFNRGVHPSSQKERTKALPVVSMPAPAVVRVPLSQHIGKPARPVVAVGEEVVTGSLIAEADGYVSANIFSPVCGTVKSVGEVGLSPVGKSLHIVIESSGKNEKLLMPVLRDPTPEQILNRIKEAGVVGMGGAGFPTHVKLQPKDKVDTLIINGAECEPFITGDHRIMLEYTDRFVEGSRLLMRALNLDKVYVGIEENKPDAIEAIQAYCKAQNLQDVFVISLKAKYPQGAEKQLIYAVTGRVVPAGGLPAAVGCVVDNVATALAVYEAVKEGKSLYERIVTVTGDAVAKPANLRVATGTSYQEVIDFCGGAAEEVEKLVSGGPMMGISVESAQCSVSKTSGCLLLLSRSLARYYDPEPCINCSQCVSACPMRLMPMFIDSALAAGDVGETEKLGVLSCIECGCCAYVCPAKRPLVQTMKLAKKKLKERS